MKLIFKLLFIFVITLTTNIQAQIGSKEFFDKQGKTTAENFSYYFRQKWDNTSLYKSFYKNGGSIYFEGVITNASSSDEGQNIFSGKCVWYFKNGNKKYVRTFDQTGKEIGMSLSYFESGKIWKEIEFEDGKPVPSKSKEYNEEGEASITFLDEFIDNSNDWDLYISDKSGSRIKGGSFELTSFENEGTSRYISYSSSSDAFSIETSLDISKLKDGGKAGIIFGFKDWQNYNFYYINKTYIYIGFVYEGIISLQADGMFSNAINKDKPNNLKIITDGDNNVYSINGEIQYKSDITKKYGSNIGFAIVGKGTIFSEYIKYKELNSSSSGSSGSSKGADAGITKTGSGIMISKDGYIATNHHVIDEAKKIFVELIVGGVPESYEAKVLQKDETNDLAIIKIEDPKFKPLDSLNYSLKESGGIEVGATAFTIGYPLALSGMGKAAKFTDGKISSKTGYNGAISTFQTTIPVQPGNSGGPVFNNKGELIGIISSSVRNTDNVSYAIKSSYLKNLIDLLADPIVTPQSSKVVNSSEEEKIKILTKYTLLIKIK